MRFGSRTKRPSSTSIRYSSRRVMPTGNPEAILREWFSNPDRWWTPDPEFDSHLRAAHADDVEAALRGELDAWARTPRGALALVIVLDQIARNIHRGTARMYAGDAKALATCLS